MSAKRRFKNGNGKNLYIYLCHFLSFRYKHWHLTSMSRANYKKINKKMKFRSNELPITEPVAKIYDKL